MQAFFRRFICRLLVVSTIMLPYSAPAQAGMIGTGQAIGSVEAQRGKVRSFVARADVQRQLAALGVEATAASERVNALTDDEVQRLAGRIDEVGTDELSTLTGEDVAAGARALGEDPQSDRPRGGLFRRR